VSLRVLHCPTNVGNHPQGLARAERAIGLASLCVQVDPGWFAYEVDEEVAPPGSGPLALELGRWKLLRRALRDFDVVHFNFGRSILPARPPVGLLEDGARHLPGRLYAHLLAFRDLPLLARAGKTIAVTFQGDDARQGTGPALPDFHRGLAQAAGEGYYTERADRLKRRAIATWDRYADRIFYVNPDLGAFLPSRARFTPYAHVQPEEWPATGPTELPDVPRIVHAPSHRGIKGTHHVVEAVERLRADGIALDFRLVEGLPYAEARLAYEEAHVLVDQVLVGWYGGLAVELMALGKPVVCHVDDDVARRFAPPQLVDELPIVRATADGLYDVLKGLLTTGRGEYGDLSQRSRAFVERWHDPRRIAERVRAEYEAARAGRS
jgi:hypothetical protein